MQICQSANPCSSVTVPPELLQGKEPQLPSWKLSSYCKLLYRLFRGVRIVLFKAKQEQNYEGNESYSTRDIGVTHLVINKCIDIGKGSHMMSKLKVRKGKVTRSEENQIVFLFTAMAQIPCAWSATCICLFDSVKKIIRKNQNQKSTQENAKDTVFENEILKSDKMRLSCCIGFENRCWFRFTYLS
jgi:hypothetical protein